MGVDNRLRYKTMAERAIRKDGPFGFRYYTIVYAISAPGSGRIKIGRTLNIDRRFSSLSTASPLPLELLGHCWLPDDAEADLHKYLEDDHSHGEWFIATIKVQEIAALIAAGNVRELAQTVGILGLLESSRAPTNAATL
jgi:hypothetical protein